MRQPKAGTGKKENAQKTSTGKTSPESINQDAIDRLRQNKKKLPSVSDLFERIRNCDIPSLSRAITLAESSRPEHQEIARELISACLPYSGNSFRLGITGIPGAGKSTFIEALGQHIVRDGKKLAVLAIDPSSERSKGSILGDKTRMEALSVMPNVYIRPSPAGGTLGGVARRTRESIILCEAAGFDTLFVETVGVGQSETAVHGMVDFFLLLMVAGAGDELQGIKRGIMEMADAIVINKADGNNLEKAERARAEFTSALHLFPPAPGNWVPEVMTCSSINLEGIAGIWDMLSQYREKVRKNGYLETKRKEQSKFWMHEAIQEGILNHVFHDPEISRKMKEYKVLISKGKITSFHAASAILNLYKSKNV